MRCAVFLLVTDPQKARRAEGKHKTQMSDMTEMSSILTVGWIVHELPGSGRCMGALNRTGAMHCAQFVRFMVEKQPQKSCDCSKDNGVGDESCRMRVCRSFGSGIDFLSFI